ncbi:MAG: GntR family transcriptional regulator [Clostridium sp.]
MVFNFTDDAPIYLQIASSIEDGILNEIYEEESQIPSTTEISVRYKINPATVGKGFNLLVSEGIVYKKRGVGMFVSEGAVEKLRGKRKSKFFDNYILNLMDEAKRLGISIDEVVDMIKGGKGNE